MSQNLLEPDPILLPAELDSPARTALEAGEDARAVAAQNPAASRPWAVLADEALGAGDAVAAYAFARTGYHRGLDALRRSGWRGAGPVPASHVPNHGFLRAVHALARAAEAIGEEEEHTRCLALLDDSDPAWREGLGLT
ncbi:DUF3151 domain-containing protein [Georgenia alba]|uniref:DUF3151 domain-containing protein n=1 Tax=Georgenia alba TaxID=2233858 RepID=A0ABW2QBH4_9MICO